MYKNSRRDGQADHGGGMVERAEERADPGDEVVVELPSIIIEIEDDDVRRVRENYSQAWRQIRHDAEFRARAFRVPHMEPQSEQNEKRDNAHDDDVGRAAAAPGRQRRFELREVRERAEYLCGDQISAIIASARWRGPNSLVGFHTAEYDARD